MSELPTGWINTIIEDVTMDALQRMPQPEEAFTYIDISSIDRETKRILNPQKLNGENAPSRARKVVKTDDVLVSMTRPNLNAVAIVPAEFNEQIASTGFDVPRATGIEARWLYYLVCSSAFVSAMSESVQGALYPAVRSKDVRGFEIALPPLNEQKRIAAKLDEVLSRVEAFRAHLERVPLVLKRFRKSVLAAAMSGRLTEDWPESHSEIQSAEALVARADELPSGWAKVTMGDVTTDAPQRQPKSEESFIYVDISSIDRDTKRILNPQHLNGENAPSRARKVLAADDVLVSMTRPNLNAVAIVPDELNGQVASTGFDVLRTSGVEARWLYYLSSLQRVCISNVRFGARCAIPCNSIQRC